MTETQMLLALVTAMFGLLTSVLAWVGTRLHSKVDALGEKISDETKAIYERMNGIDRRVTTVEARCGINHPAGG